MNPVNEASGAPWWVTIAASAISALGAASAAVVAQWKRRPKKADEAEVSDQLANAFQKLVDELQEENGRHQARIRELQEDAKRFQLQLAKLHAFCRALLRHIGVLEDQLKSLGATPVERPDVAELDLG